MHNISVFLFWYLVLGFLVYLAVQAIYTMAKNNKETREKALLIDFSFKAKVKLILLWSFILLIWYYKRFMKEESKLSHPKEGRKGNFQSRLEEMSKRQKLEPFQPKEGKKSRFLTKLEEAAERRKTS